MFSFHKPKIYRSNNGCCICKAKSSSSRFTDSKKYETEFERCFLIKEIRTGEICNACVLLVKRCKKLPKETNKHWAHVVDARAGPGTKSIKLAKSLSQNNAANKANSKSLNNCSKSSSTSLISNEKTERKICEKIQIFTKQNIIANENESNNVVSNLIEDTDLKLVQNTSTSTTNSDCNCSSCIYNRELDESEKNASKNQVSSGLRRLKKTLTPKKICTEFTSNSSSCNSSDSNEDDDEYASEEDDKIVKNDSKMITRAKSGSLHNSSYSTTDRKLSNDQSTNKVSKTQKNKRKFAVKHLRRNDSSFLDMNYWKREQVCCGIIFRNKNNDMVLIDAKLFTPCACRKKKLELQKQENKNEDKMEIVEEKKFEETIDKQVPSSSSKSFDTNNNFYLEISSTLSTPTSIKTNDSCSTTSNEVDVDDIVVININSNSGLSSDSSDISSITEEDDSNSSNNCNSTNNNILNDHSSLISQKMIITNDRTFGVL